MTRRLRIRVARAAGLTAAALAPFILPGCSSSNKPSGDNAPADIRGEPINSPKSDLNPSVARVGAGGSTNAATVETASVARAESSVATESVLKVDTKPQAGQKDSPGSVGEEFTPVAFEKLASFTFEIPDDRPSTNQVAQPSKSEEQIPATVKALNQKRVALKGFMLPLRVENGLVTEMLIMRDQSMCCYGTVPKINEWVSIKMTNKGVKAIMDQPVTIYGKLRVGEMRENGYLVGIYAMEGEKMAVPPNQ